MQHLNIGMIIRKKLAAFLVWVFISMLTKVTSRLSCSAHPHAEHSTLKDADSDPNQRGETPARFLQVEFPEVNEECRSKNPTASTSDTGHNFTKTINKTGTIHTNNRLCKNTKTVINTEIFKDLKTYLGSIFSPYSGKRNPRSIKEKRCITSRSYPPLHTLKRNHESLIQSLLRRKLGGAEPVLTATHGNQERNEKADHHAGLHSYVQHGADKSRRFVPDLILNNRTHTVDAGSIGSALNHSRVNGPLPLFHSPRLKKLTKTNENDSTSEIPRSKAPLTLLSKIRSLLHLGNSTKTERKTWTPPRPQSSFLHSKPLAKKFIRIKPDECNLRPTQSPLYGVLTFRSRGNNKETANTTNCVTSGIPNFTKPIPNLQTKIFKERYKAMPKTQNFIPQQNEQVKDYKNNETEIRTYCKNCFNNNLMENCDSETKNLLLNILKRQHEITDQISELVKLKCSPQLSSNEKILEHKEVNDDHLGNVQSSDTTHTKHAPKEKHKSKKQHAQNDNFPVLPQESNKSNTMTNVPIRIQLALNSDDEVFIMTESDFLSENSTQYSTTETAYKMAEETVYSTAATDYSTANTDYTETDQNTAETSTAATEYSTASTEYSTTLTEYNTSTTEFSTAETKYSTSTEYSTSVTENSTAETEYSTSTEYSTALTEYSTASTEYSTASTEYSTASTEYSTASIEYSTEVTEYTSKYTTITTESQKLDLSTELNEEQREVTDYISTTPYFQEPPNYEEMGQQLEEQTETQLNSKLIPSVKDGMQTWTTTSWVSDTNNVKEQVRNTNAIKDHQLATTPTDNKNSTVTLGTHNFEIHFKVSCTINIIETKNSMSEPPSLAQDNDSQANQKCNEKKQNNPFKFVIQCENLGIR
ncbi:uncharacterized protein LOC134536941 [Bacillus rossius redtenbacheri]|uniref:uncharacterized protein LOC134536941 n=1 Tax=Bacillus rossius redtenbacheri TaxID=93214 RepID=UPI002FDE4637